MFKYKINPMTKIYGCKTSIMNLSLYTLQFLIHLVNKEIHEKIGEDDIGISMNSKISVSLENGSDGVGLYLLNYDDVEINPDEMTMIRGCIKDVFNDLIQENESQ